MSLRFRGKRAWPQFRSLQPGWLPWFLDKDEARLLTAALEQSLEVLERIKEQTIELVSYEDGDLVLTRYEQRGRWREEWRRPATPERQGGLSGSINPARLEGLRESAGKPSGTWEFDIFPVPGTLPSSSGRLYYPHLSMAVDRSNGMVIGFDITGPVPDAHSKQEAIVNLFERIGLLPRQLRVSTNAMRDMMEPLAKALGIGVRVSVLPSLAGAKAGLVDMMMEEDFF